MGQNAVNNKQYISQFWFLKLTKRYKFKFCFCLKLRYKAFLTILVNIYHIFFFYMVIYNEHIPQDIPLSVLSRGRNSLTLALQILLWNSVKITWGGRCNPTTNSQKYPPPQKKWNVEDKLDEKDVCLSSCFCTYLEILPNRFLTFFLASKNSLTSSGFVS